MLKYTVHDEGCPYGFTAHSTVARARARARAIKQSGGRPKIIRFFYRDRRSRVARRHRRVLSLRDPRAID